MCTSWFARQWLKSEFGLPVSNSGAALVTLEAFLGQLEVDPPESLLSHSGCLKIVWALGGF